MILFFSNNEEKLKKKPQINLLLTIFNHFLFLYNNINLNLPINMYANKAKCFLSFIRRKTERFVFF